MSHWFFRYKLYHIPLWLLYHFSWWALTLGSASAAATSLFQSVYISKFLFYVVFQAIAVYFNLYFLMPRFLARGKYVSYTLYVMLTILLASACIVPGYYITAWISESTFEELFKLSPDNYMHLFKINALPSTAASMTLGMSVKLTKHWIHSTRKQQLLEKEKLETELNFLKSQFNPHFLFNTINSIFILIHKNPDLATNALAKFSDLLRYQLYDCNAVQIPLKSEIGYLESYIELQRLRLNPSLQLNLDIQGVHDHHVTIAPFILITFTENAFKHVSSHPDRQNWISIQLSSKGRELHFKISNSITSDNTQDVIRYGGIGLKNVKRRLELIYPEQHHLDVQKTETTFEVTLRLQLAETEVPFPKESIVLNYKI